MRSFDSLKGELYFRRIMLFSSIEFLYYFLPAVMILYFLVPKALKNAVLLVASLIFYAWGEPMYVFLMIGVILVGYLFGLGMQTRFKKLCLVGSIVCLLLILGYFKYVDFFIESFNAVTGLSVGLLRVALPIGISFYTFQVLSYEIDVYRGNVKVQKNIIDFATFVALFPQLIAGPIVRYADIEAQLKTREHTMQRFREGLGRFIVGLAKKALIANNLAAFVSAFRASTNPSVLFYWLYALAFTLQLYFDFSGYSDMAIGLGKIFGFDFPENFDYPYLSKSATEFWRRWHKTLGGWFRDYVYIPLGGNRVKKWRWVFNTFVVWLLTGLWHGAAWNFVLWGLLFFVLLMIEKLWLKRYLDKSKVLSRVYLLFFVVMSFVLFNANSMAEAGKDFACLFGFGDLPFINEETIYYLRSNAVLFLAGIVGSVPLVKNLVVRMRSTGWGEKVFAVAEPVVLLGFLLLVTAYLVDGSFNPFLYFRF